MHAIILGRSDSNLIELLTRLPGTAISPVVQAPQAAVSKSSLGLGCTFPVIITSLFSTVIFSTKPRPSHVMCPCARSPRSKGEASNRTTVSDSVRIVIIDSSASSSYSGTGPSLDKR